VQFVAPAGSIVFTFTIMDKAGQPLATAKKQLTILKGQANSGLQVVLSGIVASVKLLVPSMTAGFPLSAQLVFTAQDASGATIDASAPFATPIVLTDTDHTLSTHLEVRNGIGPTAQLNSAGDVVTFIYDGNPTTPAFMINATVGTTAVGSSGSIVPLTQAISFTNTFIDTGAPSDPNYQQPTIYFANRQYAVRPVSTTTTASENSYSGQFTAVLDPVTCASSGGARSRAFRVVPGRPLP